MCTPRPRLYAHGFALGSAAAGLPRQPLLLAPHRLPACLQSFAPHPSPPTPPPRDKRPRPVAHPALSHHPPPPSPSSTCHPFMPELLPHLQGQDQPCAGGGGGLQARRSSLRYGRAGVGGWVGGWAEGWRTSLCCRRRRRFPARPTTHTLPVRAPPLQFTTAEALLREYCDFSAEGLIGDTLIGTWRRCPCARAAPCRSMPCRAVPCRAVPCRAVPCRAVPRRVVLTGTDHGSGLGVGRSRHSCVRLGRAVVCASLGMQAAPPHSAYAPPCPPFHHPPMPACRHLGSQLPGRSTCVHAVLRHPCTPIRLPHLPAAARVGGACVGGWVEVPGWQGGL